MKRQYNYLRQEISSDKQFRPIDMKYFIDPDHPNWKEYIQFGDQWGFDVRYKMDQHGNYVVKVVLPAGKKIIRYGLDTGKFTADADTPYELLSLPYRIESVLYHEYVVCENCEVECFVDKGRVAPGFGSQGGAIQYRHYMSINESVRRGILEEVFQWLKI